MQGELPDTMKLSNESGECLRGSSVGCTIGKATFLVWARDRKDLASESPKDMNNG